jgi:hypothetical protein
LNYSFFDRLTLNNMHLVETSKVVQLTTNPSSNKFE